MAGLPYAPPSCCTLVSNGSNWKSERISCHLPAHFELHQGRRHGVRHCRLELPAVQLSFTQPQNSSQARVWHKIPTWTLSQSRLGKHSRRAYSGHSLVRCSLSVSAGADENDGRGESAEGYSLRQQSFYELNLSVLSNIVTASAAAIADPIMSLVDTAFVGRLGIVELAALGPNACIFNAVFFFWSFTGAVVSTEHIGAAHARGDLEEVQKSLALATLLAAVAGTLITIVMLSAAVPMLQAMGTNADMLPPALVYFRFRAFAAPAALLLLVFQSAYRAVQDLRTPCLVVLACGILNAILDPILMFTAGWGVAGAAIATTCSQWVGAIAFVVLMLNNENFVRSPGLKSVPAAVWRPPLRAYVGYLQECSGLALRAAIIIAIYSLASVAAVRLGTLEAAGFQLVEQIQSFQLTILWSFMEVGQAMVVHAVGARSRKAARRVADCVIAWCGAASLLLGWATWLLRKPLVLLFSRDQQVMAMVESAMLPACAMLVMGWNNGFEGVLLGAGDTAFVVASFLPAAGTGILMLLYVMMAQTGVPSIWWALALYYTLLTAEYAARYWIFRKHI